jgi:2-polyprenyl-3-methyl-5-hydroxy-6-metoxy-1,4-benzoquinol methylase
LHELLFDKIAEDVESSGAVLDLAAGSGSMSLGLHDFSFRVTSADYVMDNFRLHKIIHFFQADLNSRFSFGRESQFDAIVAAEIIEHIENPRHFARECFKLLKPGGKLSYLRPILIQMHLLLVTYAKEHINGLVMQITNMMVI